MAEPSRGTPGVHSDVAARPAAQSVSGPDGVTGDADLVTAWGLVLEAVAAADRLFEADLQRTVGLPPPWVEVLFRLRRTPHHFLPTTRLAREVAFSSGGFTKVMDRMVEAGLVERLPCPTDRRVIYAALTPRGVEVADRALEVHAEGLRRYVLASLGPARLATLADTMRLLRDALCPTAD